MAKLASKLAKDYRLGRRRCSCVALHARLGGWLATAASVSVADPDQVTGGFALANLSGEADQEYFADGMTEELTTDLGKISALRVISRTSAMQYKGSKKPLQEIAGSSTWMRSWKERWRGRGATYTLPQI